MSGVPAEPLGQARWAARGLLADLDALAPEAAAVRRAQLEGMGLRWLTAVDDEGLDVVEEPVEDVVSIAEACRVLGVPRGTVDSWRSRRVVQRLPGAVLLSECRAAQAREVARRGGGLRVVS